jgi:hypothetical protein
VIQALEPEVQVPAELEPAQAAYRRVLDGRRVLLLLDNAESSAQVQPLIDWRAPATMVLATSRQTLTAPGLKSLQLDVMDPGEAKALLRAALGEREVSEADLEALAERCGRLPLALRVAGTFLAESPEWSMERYLNALADEKKRPEIMKFGEGLELDVYATLGLSAAKLHGEKPAVAERWQLLSVLPASFDLAAAAAVWELDRDAAVADLGELRRRSMVQLDEADKRWRLHDLMRDAAALPLDGQHQDDIERHLEAARARHARHYCAVLSAADDLYLKGHDGVLAGLAVYDLEQRNIAAGQAWAAARIGVDDGATRLAADYPNAVYMVPSQFV